MIKKISSEIIYENPWLRVHEDTVEFPNGKQGIYAYTERVDAGPMIIPVTADGTLILLKEWRYPIQDWTYCFPFGGVEVGEDFLTAAKRELAEETGFIAEKWESLGEIKIDPGANSQVTPVFLATGLSAGKARLDGSEVHEVMEFTVEEIKRKIATGEMNGGWLLAGLAKYLVHKN